MHVAKIISAVSSCESSDGHEAEACLAADRDVFCSARSKGFVAERFVKPPVDLELVLEAVGDVAAVVLCPKVGSQVSRSLSIARGGAVVVRIEVAQEDEDKLFVVKRRNVSMEEDVAPLLSPASAVMPVVVKNFDTNTRALAHVKSLVIRIHRAKSSGSMALGCVQVLCAGAATRESKTDKPVAEANKTDKPFAEANTNAEKDDDWMMDELTMEPMHDPVILPSGRVVDRSTALKHLDRQARDPFTQLPLTAAQLVPAESLRLRIDRHWLERGDAPDRPTAASSHHVLGHDDNAEVLSTEMLMQRREQLAVDRRQRPQDTSTNNDTKRTRFL